MITSSQDFLTWVSADCSKHYLWLCSLSYLEYIGYRKMVKTLGHGLDKNTYQHLSDEIHHSLMLKEMAEKLKASSDKEFSQAYIQLSEDYFQSIDQATEDWVIAETEAKNPFLCYLLVSYLIEKRAMQLYPQYLAKNKKSPLASVLQKIIKDEQAHLSYLENTLKHTKELPAFEASKVWSIEEKCFYNYLNQLKKQISN